MELLPRSRDESTWLFVQTQVVITPYHLISYSLVSCQTVAMYFRNIMNKIWEYSKSEKVLCLPLRHELLM